MNQITLKREELSYGVTEELKTLRTNLVFSGMDKRVIMLTSSISGEGKSKIAYELAISLAELNHRVLLIDADLRKSVMVRILQDSKFGKGLAHYLSGQCQLSDIVTKTNVSKLHVIFAGPPVPNPTELFSKELFGKTIAALRDTYDYIIIDTAPIGMVIDAAIVSKVCDASVLVIEAGEIKRKFAQSTVQKLQQLECPLLGVILNKVDRRKNGEYYGKQYKKYYGKKYE